jgi:hypothetical protein
LSGQLGQEAMLVAQAQAAAARVSRRPAVTPKVPRRTRFILVALALVVLVRLLV